MIQPNELQPEIDRLTKAIARVFTIEGDLEEAELEQLHNRFVECIEITNGRLKQCDELLRKGLRVEAIHESEIEPDLLDLVTELDIPEWESWAEYVRQFGIPRQPDLLGHVAGELNEAYSQAQSLDGLLRLHRLHALARSPLQERIPVLRNIAAKDSSNSVWKDDLSGYEKARFRQLESELTLHKDNLEQMREIWSEISQTPWSVTPSTKLVDKAERIHQNLLAAEAQARLVELEQRINAAFSEFNVEQAEIARIEWDEYASIAQLSETDELALQVSAAFEWLEQERGAEAQRGGFQHAIRSLEHLLDQDKVTATSLDRAFGAVEKYEESIPKSLQRRYQERVNRISLVASRRSRLVVASSLAVVLTVGTLVMYLMSARKHSDAVLAASGSLSELITDGHLEQAESLYQRLKTSQPAIAESPEIQQLHAELKAQFSQEESRKARISQLVEEALATFREDATWETVGKTKKILAQAESLTQGESELLGIRKAESELAKVEGDLQEATNSEFLEKVGDLEEKVVTLEDMSRAQIKELSFKAEQLKKYPHVSASFLKGSGIDLILFKLAGRDKLLARMSDEERYLLAVQRSIGQESSYRTALENYVQNIGYGRRPQDFKKVLQHDISFLEKAASWNDVASRWNDLDRIDNVRSASLAQEMLDELKGSYTGYPSVDAALKLRPYIDSILQRTDTSGTTIGESLTAMFRKDVFNMNYMQEKAGDRYYFFGTPRPTAGRSDEMNVSALVDATDLLRVNPKRFPVGDLVKLVGNDRVAPAPHSEFARVATEKLAESDKSFEHRICAVIYLLLTKKQIDPLNQIDPLLRCGILQYIVKEAQRGSDILEQELAPLEASLSTAIDVNDVNWLDHDEETNVLRERTRAQLDRITFDLGEVYTKKVVPRVDSFNKHKPILPELTWVACLMKDVPLEWKSELRRGYKAGEPGMLVIADFEQDRSSNVHAIGKVRDKKLILDSEEHSRFLEGRPVFLITDTKE